MNHTKEYLLLEKLYRHIQFVEYQRLDLKYLHFLDYELVQRLRKMEKEQKDNEN